VYAKDLIRKKDKKCNRLPPDNNERVAMTTTSRNVNEDIKERQLTLDELVACTIKTVVSMKFEIKVTSLFMQSYWDVILLFLLDNYETIISLQFPNPNG
jgi:hypothetical protein